MSYQHGLQLSSSCVPVLPVIACQENYMVNYVYSRT